MNVPRVTASGVESTSSLRLLFDERLEGRISTSARFEENIALAGILACHELGTIEKRPDGKPFNPYALTEDELNRAGELLKKQRGLLLTRWNDEDTLERMLRDEQVWVSPEWSGIYRRLRFEELDNVSSIKVKHVLKPDEGGLGWVDTWCMTRGAVADPAIEELAYQWMNFRLSNNAMKTIAVDVGWAPCVDIRSDLRNEEQGERYIETLFLNRTADIRGLYQFDKPSNPERWEEVWSDVLSG